jgi:hypothetical protein
LKGGRTETGEACIAEQHEAGRAKLIIRLAEMNAEMAVVDTAAARADAAVQTVVVVAQIGGLDDGAGRECTAGDMVGAVDEVRTGDAASGMCDAIIASEGNMTIVWSGHSELRCPKPSPVDAKHLCGAPSFISTVGTCGRRT